MQSLPVIARFRHMRAGAASETDFPNVGVVVLKSWRAAAIPRQWRAPSITSGPRLRRLPCARRRRGVRLLLGALVCYSVSWQAFPSALFFFIDVFPRGTLAQVAGWSALWRRYSWHDWCASSGYPCSCLSRLLSRWFVSDDVLITRLLSLADTTTPRLIGCFLRLSPPHPEGAFLNLSVGRSFDH